MIPSQMTLNLEPEGLTLIREPDTMSLSPSWIRGRGNCCETCSAWSKDRDYDFVGLCCSAISLDSGEKTDSRYRCQSFIRKDGT